MSTLAPPPTKAPDGSFYWLDWYNKLHAFLTTVGSLPWANIDFTGSSLGDIANRPHNILQSIQGGTTGEYYHLTNAQWTVLTAFNGQHNNLSGLQGGTTSQYYHLTSAQQTLVANWTHNSLNGLQGGTTGQYYHLTSAQQTLVVNWDHQSLNNLQGGTSGQYYHLTSAEYTRLQAGQLPMNSKATDPVAADIPAGNAAIYKNTTSGLVKLWVNDGGTFKSVTLT